MNKITIPRLTIGRPGRSYDGKQVAMILSHLARRAAAGSDSALSELLRHLRSRIMSVLRRQGVPRQDRGDLASEIAFKLYSNLPRLVGADSNIVAWIGRVTRNHAHDYHERQARGRSRAAVDVASLPSSSYTVGAEHLDAAQLIGTLTRRERAVFDLHMVGHRHEEIGSMLRVSADHSRRILADARFRLRKALQSKACTTHAV